jgi:phytoene dehydrogenase-like protein
VEQTGASTPITEAPALGVSTVWRTIRSYVLWSYERGSFHYDVMVTLILLFVFFTPYWINYKDKPTERNPHPTVVSVLPDTEGGFLYQIGGAAISAKDDGEAKDQLLQIIEPIAGGTVTITRYQAVKDSKGRISSYKVWVQR